MPPVVRRVEGRRRLVLEVVTVAANILAAQVLEQHQRELIPAASQILFSCIERARK